MKEVKVMVPDGKQAEWKEVNGVMMLVLVDEQEQDNRPVTERIKTFDDACRELGRMSENGDEIAMGLIQDWNNLKTKSLELIAYHKLRIIVYAINEGWSPKFTSSEYRYYNWFYLYTKDELDAMDEDDRRRVVGRASYNAFASGGCVCAYAYHASSYSYTPVGARLAFKDRERAEYAGRQFAELWAQFFFDNAVEGWEWKENA